MSRLNVRQFICRSDNFGLLLHDEDSSLTASIDTPDGEAILEQLRIRGWRLSHIFNTHHHYDHVPGNELLKRETGCVIVGSKKDADRIPLIDERMEDLETFMFAGHPVQLIETPGHTSGSVCFYLPDDGLLFTGDTLFSMGCGRLFEGTPEMMWRSLQRLRALPDDTQVYCGHEYTITNAEFALEVEPDNEALRQRAEQARQLRRNRQATLPVSLGMEKATNPFLRPDQSDIQRHFDLMEQPVEETFAALRELRNRF